MLRGSSVRAVVLVAGLFLWGGCDGESVTDAGRSQDGGTRDAGLRDAEPPDAAPGDSGPGDGGPGDSGPGDSGPSDAGPLDACAASEACNGADDDCDGRTDEGFDLDNDAAHCGACDMACESGEVCRFARCVDDVPRPVRVTAGAAHTCVLMSDGEVRCWGDNQRGQLGQGDLAPHTGIATVMTLSNIQAIDAGAHHSCAITRSNVAVCWGDDAAGQIGDRAPVGEPRPRTIPAGVSGGIVGVEHIALGEQTSCAGTPFGSLFCWGANAAGQIGDGTTEQRDSATPVMRDGRLFDGIDSGQQHTCALRRVTGAPSEVWCWGANAHGAFGDGGFADSTTPRVSGFTEASGVQTGAGITCVRTPEGQVRCAGLNRRGALGDSVSVHSDFDEVDRSARPVTVAGLDEVAQLALSVEHACARRDDGTVRCWGSNSRGQLGDGAVHQPCQDRTELDCAFSPVAVSGLADAVDVAAGAEHSCALLRDSSVWCWGRNAEGQLGVAGVEDRPVPVEVPF